MTRDEAIQAGKTHLVKFMMGGGGRYVTLGNDGSMPGTVCLPAPDFQKIGRRVSSSYGWKGGLKAFMRDNADKARAVAMHANGTATMAVRMKDGRVETLGMTWEKLTAESPTVQPMPKRF